ncbi:hypothetical protein M409DRAFT_24954 [Zasmidium cellare ATCC 36951]|uniref:SnoaL-like domain-containing protein n=1 Tax=Zasmidium cellare ATCC 36951 TaxID=1080233 RepID=A0A6A6CBL7_ZASCE|nr:uncharacterized protein M409DRAFT_24954 [Zasmidium cellare ATCC 36951]KAF2164554.1 hypothetical protein M409DRAFT_24954 [Zasmidium cellare ATCC 36951]
MSLSEVPTLDSSTTTPETSSVSTPETISSTSSNCTICQQRSPAAYVKPSTAISIHLEHLVRSSIQAINSRDFSIYSSAWSCYTPGLKVESAQPVYQWPNCIRKNIGLRSHLKGLHYIASSNPGFFLRVLEVDSQVHEKAGRATVFVNLENIGNPTNLVMEGVIILEFCMMGEEWKCVKFTGARGIM